MKDIITAQIATWAERKASLLLQKQQLRAHLAQIDNNILRLDGAIEGGQVLLVEAEKQEASRAAAEEAEEAEAQAEQDAENAQDAEGNGCVPPAIAERLGGLPQE